MIHLILTKLTKRKRPGSIISNFINQVTSLAPKQIDNNDTIDLVLQLRSVLILCQNTGLYILSINKEHNSDSTPSNSQTNSPAPPLSPATQSFNDTSSIHTQLKKEQYNEFDIILQLLNELIMIDCRYICSHPKPSRPPFTLQSTVIDIAIILVEARHDIHSLYSIGSTMIQAFESFPESILKVKLLSFFVDMLLPKLMHKHDLYEREQVNNITTFKKKKIKNYEQENVQHSYPSSSGDTPIINVQSPEGNNDDINTPYTNIPINDGNNNRNNFNSNNSKSTHLTIDTRSVPRFPSMLSPATPRSVKSYQTHAFIDIIKQQALFTPLLTFMIQYFDPYLDEQQMATEDLPKLFSGKTYSIFNFHQALQFIMQQKPDIYLDILQIIAYGTEDVRFRACQILSHYYPDSLGHIVIAGALPKLGVYTEISQLDEQRKINEQLQRKMSADTAAATALLEHQNYGSTIQTGSIHTIGINRKYGSPNTPMSTPQRSTTLDTIDFGDDSENEEMRHHIWYPHIFFNLNDQQHGNCRSQGIMSNIDNDMDGYYCNNCYKAIIGFGLRCYQCKRNLHYNCYNYLLGEDDVDTMLYIKSGGVQKVVSPQFCHYYIQPRYSAICKAHENDCHHHHLHTIVQHLGHRFHLVNLYTLLLCACCQKPLWGISQQGYRCSTCNRYVHLSCLSQSLHNYETSSSFNKSSSILKECHAHQTFLESDTRISLNQLLESLDQYYDDMMPKSMDDLKGRSYEEVGTILNTLLVQDYILQNGVTASCIVIDGDDPLLTKGKSIITNSGPQFTTTMSESILQNNNNNDNNNSSTESRVYMIDHKASFILNNPIELCQQYITSDQCKASSFLSDFNMTTKWRSFSSCFEYLLSDEDYLSHIAAMMKSLTTSKDMDFDGTTDYNEYFKSTENNNNNKNDNKLLQVIPQHSTSPRHLPTTDDSTGQLDMYCDIISPQNILDRDTLLSWIMDSLYIKSSKVAKILLQHIRNLGLFERNDTFPILFSDDNDHLVQPETTVVNDNRTLCIFPIPYAIDNSSHIETLINVIESCLDDINIAINEYGFLMLTRRCWPDPFMSRYTNERLMTAILRWILLEDKKLTSLYAAFTVTNTIQLPGVKKNKWTQATSISALLSASDLNSTAPAANNEIHLNGGGNNGKNQRHSHFIGTGISSGAGNVYVTTRGSLRDRYITQWLKAVHDINPEGYASLLNDAIENVVESVMDDTADYELDHKDYLKEKKTSILQYFDTLVNYLVKLKSLGYTFSSLDSIVKWQLDRAYHDYEYLNILKDNVPVEVKALSKLFSSKALISKSADQKVTVDDNFSPFDIISNAFLDNDNDSINRGIRWLTLIVHSGTGINSTVLDKIAKSLVQAQASIATTTEFIKLIWFQVSNNLNTAIPHTSIIDIISYLNESALESLKLKNQSEDLSIERLTSAQTFIKYSAVLICFAYGCPLINIAELDIVPFSTNISQQLNGKLSLNIEQTSLTQMDDKVSIIKCMMLYLQFDQLNVREDIIKMFHALIHWGTAINNKNDFIVKCVPNLIPTIWELLSPLHDDVNEINLNLLMKLISVDPKPFHTCVFKIMEDDNWEIRYQGLDNLYGLFTKMDVAFQTKWLSLLCQLGPVFSYFISSIWDKQENVRSKTLALLRTFGTLHLRSAFRCWEAYFMIANDKQRRSLVNLMIQLNSLFPDWQVLQWESLLEALEAKLPASMSSDILVQYTRPSFDIPSLLTKNMKQQQQEERHSISMENENENKNENKRTSKDIKVDELESENTKVLMMTLALQMLSNHLSIDLTQISRLKLLLVVHMGFQNCERYNTSGDWEVSFGIMQYNTEDTLQTAMMTACSRGLKKIMDSFAPLPAETVAAMAPEILEQNKLKLTENSSPGVHFIDVVLKLFTSGIELTKINQIILKSWLDTILIVIHKHNILDNDYEHTIASCMKHIIDLITKNIGEENKLLILEILKCLLRRSDHLTAMVLSKQILALGKLITKSGKKTNEPVFLKAKQFLKNAFLRFAVAGLFVLIFKNQTVQDASNEIDLFFVLRMVIDPEDIVPDEDQIQILYLRDQPVRDVLDKLMKQQMDRKSFSTVLENMSRYVETVHSHPYPEPVLSDYADFLGLLVKYTSEWRRSDWNINPLFTMSAILLLEHPYHFEILLPSIQLLFRHGLRQCNVQTESIVSLMAAYSTISTIPGTPTENIFVEAIIDEIRSGLTTRQKLHKETMLTLLQLILWDYDDAYQQWYISIEKMYISERIGKKRRHYFNSNLKRLLDPMVNYLKASTTSDQFTKKDFKSYNTIAHILALCCKSDKDNMYRILYMLKLDETRHCLRFLSWFILCLLKNQYDELLEIILNAEDVLIELLVQIFQSIQINFDRPDPGFSYSTSGEALVLCFLIFKIWTLLILRIVNKDSLLNKQAKKNKSYFWISIWPPLSRLLYSIDPSTLLLPGNTGLSIWNMFLSLIQFLHMCRSNAVMVNSFDWCTILDNILSQVENIENHSNLFKEQTIQNNDNDDIIKPFIEFKQQAKRIRQMFIIPPIEAPTTTLIEQLYLELKDIVRLQSITPDQLDLLDKNISTASGFSF
ncbi:unnamed protein product [Cunninghamella echinulata]